MKKFVLAFTLITLLTFSTETVAQNYVVRRPQAAHSGERSGISGATIAAGLGVIVAIAAIALISNNSHSH